MSSIKTELEEVIAHTDKLLEAYGLVLVDARFSQQGKSRSIEIVIHRPGGSISLDDCEKISRALDETVSSLVSGSFSLEIQSPGIDRVLKSSRELSVFTGHLVEIKLKEKIDTLGDCFNATLLSSTPESITVGSPYKSASSNKRSKIEQKPAFETLTLDRSQIIQLCLLPQPTSNESGSVDPAPLIQSTSKHI